MTRYLLIGLLFSIFAFSCRKTPVPAYEVEVLNCTDPYNLKFINTSTDYSDYEWIINGVSFHNTNPTLSLSDSVQHNLQLIVNNGKKSESLSHTFWALDFYHLPTPDFSWNFPDCHNFLTTEFYNYAEGNIDSYYWEFGDGQTSTLQHPVHTFAAAGNYTTTLHTIRCDDTTSKPITVFVDPSNVFPEANFRFDSDEEMLDDDEILLGYPLKFKNKSSHATSYLWRFDDGSSSSSTSPTHTYNYEGTYHVELVSICGNQRDSITKTVTVREPEKCYISKIKILDFPSQNGGSDWDDPDEETSSSDSRPDIYIVLKKGSSEIFESSTENDQSDHNNPEWSVRKTLNSMTYDYTIEVFDEDPNSDQLMEIVEFELEDFFDFGDYPDRFVISHDDTDIQLSVEWR